MDMTSVRVVSVPSELQPADVVGRAVMVFDVLRATTSMAAALSAGVTEIRVFDSLDAARTCASTWVGAKLLAGEMKCLPPADFDLGNSPGDFTSARCHGQTILMSTTNGTRALVAARDARHLMTGALVNAAASARSILATGLPITLLCAGTAGDIAPEDLLGAAQVITELCTLGPVELENDNARFALDLLEESRGRVMEFLRSTQGGRNIIAAGLERDIEFAGRVNSIDVASVVAAGADALIVTRAA